MSTTKTWKSMLFELVEKYIPNPSIDYGLRSSDPEIYKKEIEDNYRGTAVGSQIDGYVSGPSFRISGDNLFDTWLYTYWNNATYKWSTDLRIVITIEGIKIKEEIKKAFGDNVLNYCHGTFRELSPDRIKIKGKKLTFRVSDSIALHEESCEVPFAKNIYDFVMAAHKLAEEYPDLYDDAIDEFAPSKDEDDD